MSKQTSAIFVVVGVYSGIPLDVEGYFSEDAAFRRAEELRAESDPESGEVAVFEVVPQ